MMMVVLLMSMNWKVNIHFSHQPLLPPPPNPLPHPLLLLHLLMRMGVMVTHFYHHLIHHQCWLWTFCCTHMQVTALKPTIKSSQFQLMNLFKIIPSTMMMQTSVLNVQELVPMIARYHWPWVLLSQHWKPICLRTNFRYLAQEIWRICRVARMAPKLLSCLFYAVFWNV